MSVDYLSVTEQIRQYESRIAENEKRKTDQMSLAREWLDQYSDELDFLKEQVAHNVEKNKGVRCAVPREDALKSRFSCPEEYRSTPTILAADGSQIFADRHRPIEFALINLCVIKLDANQHIHKPSIHTELILSEEENPSPEQLRDDYISLKRDSQERQYLNTMAGQEQQPVIALSDGPLELFREPHEGKSHQDLFNHYLQALLEFCTAGGIAAGYVDRPKADLITHLLEIAGLDAQTLPGTRLKWQSNIITDAALYSEILRSGERSGIFRLQSSSAMLFENTSQTITLNFFYLNVGDKIPNIVRVEIPESVACEPTQVDLLHQALLNQCRKMGSRPYPYLLHRAHEEALITFHEAKQIEQLLLRKTVAHHQIPQFTSNKQALKNLSGKAGKHTL